MVPSEGVLESPDGNAPPDRRFIPHSLAYGSTRDRSFSQCCVNLQPGSGRAKKSPAKRRGFKDIISWDDYSALPKFQRAST
jgi:hypothetical protein